MASGAFVPTGGGTINLNRFNVVNELAFFVPADSYAEVRISALAIADVDDRRTANVSVSLNSVPYFSIRANSDNVVVTFLEKNLILPANAQLRYSGNFGALSSATNSLQIIYTIFTNT